MWKKGCTNGICTDGKTYNAIHYNLDMILSLGYRVKSKIATNFRRWATERLKEYMSVRMQVSCSWD